jgi:predicted transcriptional regulator
MAVRRKKRRSTRFIEAFEKVISVRGAPAQVVVGKPVMETILMSPERQRIFRYICRFPCNHLSGIARDLNISFSAVKWHVNILVSNKFLDATKVENRLVYLPQKLIEQKNIAILNYLHNKLVSEILRLILTQPGVVQNAIYNKLNIPRRTCIEYLKSLKRFGIIRELKDGRYRRYQATDLLFAASKSYKLRVYRTAKSLKTRLAADGLQTGDILWGKDQVQIPIRYGNKKSTFILSLIPMFDIVFKRKYLAT